MAPAVHEPQPTPWEECLAITRSIKAKADKNKRRARLAVAGLTGSTAAIPVLIGLGQNSWFWGRLAPSVLAAVAALVTALVQLERPHERWALYRRYHRRLEVEQLLYKFGIEPYSGEDRDSLLARRIGQLQLDLHDEWEGLLPRSQDMTAAALPTSADRRP